MICYGKPIFIVFKVCVTLRKLVMYAQWNDLRGNTSKYAIFLEYENP